MSRTGWRLGATLLGLGAFAGPGAVVGTLAQAGSLSVSPTRIELSARHPVATLEVTNDGAGLITVQLETLAWTQAEGTDDYVENAELIATPSIFELAAHASQVLRIAVRDPAPGVGRAFRVYASEVPPARLQEGAGLQMVLRVGVPVFVEMATGSSRFRGTVLKRPDGAATLRLHNLGTRFTRVLGLELRGATGAPVWSTRSAAYLLTGGEHDWPLDDARTLPAGAPLQLSITTENGGERIDVDSIP